MLPRGLVHAGEKAHYASELEVLIQQTESMLAERAEVRRFPEALAVGLAPWAHLLRPAPPLRRPVHFSHVFAAQAAAA